MEWMARYWLEALFGVVLAAMAAGYRRLAKRLKSRNEKDKALENGVRAILRNDIITLADKYLDAGDIPVYALETITGMYEAYHELGGNGTITKLVEEVKKLPTRH